MLMTRKDIRDFCIDFAYKFISTECMEKSFIKITCGDAQEVKEHLENTMDLDIYDWLEEHGIEIEED